MAGKVSNKMCVAVACLVALIQISSSFAANTWYVGGSGGWTQSGDYTTWASGKTFAIGDTLNFVFTSGVHTVTKVSKSDYDTCTITNGDNIPPDVKLTTNGTHYYICKLHCTSGQKLAITVGSSSASTPSGVVAGAGLVMPFLVGAAAFLM